MALVDKVTWEVDREAEKVYPKAYPNTLVATLNDGRAVESHFDFPKGDPENPASMEDITNKFALLTEKVLDRHKRERIADEIDSLESMPDVSLLGDLLR